MFGMPLEEGEVNSRQLAHDDQATNRPKERWIAKEIQLVKALFRRATHVCIEEFTNIINVMVVSPPSFAICQKSFCFSSAFPSSSLVLPLIFGLLLLSIRLRLLLGQNLDNRFASSSPERLSSFEGRPLQLCIKLRPIVSLLFGCSSW